MGFTPTLLPPQTPDSRSAKTQGPATMATPNVQVLRADILYNFLVKRYGDNALPPANMIYALAGSSLFGRCTQLMIPFVHIHDILDPLITDATSSSCPARSLPHGGVLDYHIRILGSRKATAMVSLFPYHNAQPEQQ